MMLLLTLRGTPTIYYGEELGMENVEIPPDREQDPVGLRVPGLGHRAAIPSARPCSGMPRPTQALPRRELNPGCRRHRTFSNAMSRWRRRTRNRLLNLTHELLALRKSHPALAIGDYAVHRGLAGRVLRLHP